MKVQCFQYIGFRCQPAPLYILERTLEPVKKPGAVAAPYTARDFHIGNVLEIHSHRFELLATDAATETVLAALGLGSVPAAAP